MHLSIATRILVPMGMWMRMLSIPLDGCKKLIEMGSSGEHITHNFHSLQIHKVGHGKFNSEGRGRHRDLVDDIV